MPFCSRRCSKLMGGVGIFRGMFHVEHYDLIDIRRTATSAGVTPLIREAGPNEYGLIFVNFSLPSLLSERIEE